MNLTAAEVCNLARIEVQDSTKEFWTDQELLDYLNEGRDTLYMAVPRVYEVAETATLVEGARQTLPNASKRLFGLIENLTAESRRLITPINRETLTRLRPSWRGEDPSDEILHFSYVETEPTVYETYPPAMAGTQVRISYARPPTKLALVEAALPTTALTSEAELARALVQYVVGKAFAKQSDTSPDAGQRSQAAFGMFMQMIGAEDAGKRDSSPNTLAIAGKPTEATNR
jgi:hypothetical protein